MGATDTNTAYKGIKYEHVSARMAGSQQDIGSLSIIKATDIFISQEMLIPVSLLKI